MCWSHARRRWAELARVEACLGSVWCDGVGAVATIGWSRGGLHHRSKPPCLAALVVDTKSQDPANQVNLGARRSYPDARREFSQPVSLPSHSGRALAGGVFSLPIRYDDHVLVEPSPKDWPELCFVSGLAH